MEGVSLEEEVSRSLCTWEGWSIAFVSVMTMVGIHTTHPPILFLMTILGEEQMLQGAKVCVGSSSFHAFWPCLIRITSITQSVSPSDCRILPPPLVSYTADSHPIFAFEKSISVHSVSTALKPSLAAPMHNPPGCCA